MFRGCLVRVGLVGVYLRRLRGLFRVGLGFAFGLSLEKTCCDFLRQAQKWSKRVGLEPNKNTNICHYMSYIYIYMYIYRR